MLSYFMLESACQFLRAAEHRDRRTGSGTRQQIRITAGLCDFGQGH